MVVPMKATAAALDRRRREDDDVIEAAALALARIGGTPCMLVANQPAVLAGAITRDAAEKATHFIDVANTFGLPVTADATQATTDGSDFYFIVFEREATGLLYATFFGGNISRAARLAKKDRKDFYDVIRRTGVDPSQFR